MSGRFCAIGCAALVLLAGAPARAQWVRAPSCPTRVGLTQVVAQPTLICGAVTFPMSAKGNFGGGQTATLDLEYAIANGQYNRTSACVSCNGQYLFQLDSCTNCGGDAGTDATPPDAGTVADGLGVDVDAQSSTTALSANWSGFSDPQTGIASYAWAIGTSVGGTEVQPFTGVGLVSSATASGLTLVSGAAYYVTVEARNGGGLTTRVSSDGVTVTVATTRLAFTTPARTLAAGTCSAAITVQLRDQNSAPVAASGPLSVVASSSSSFGAWYTDAACTVAAAGASFTIPAGQSSVNLFYLDPNAGTPSVSLANTGGHINPAPQVQTVLPGAPAQLVFTSPPRTLAAGTCAGAANAISVTLLDTWGNTATAGALGEQVVAKSSSTGTSAWYHDAACTTVAVNGAFTIAPGLSGVQLFYSDTSAGSPEVTVSGAGGVTASAPQAVTVVPGPAAALRWSVQPSNTRVGERLTPAVVVELFDAVGNLVGAGSSPITLSLVDVAATGATLGGTLTRATQAGRTLFDDLSVDRAGIGYQLHASATGLARVPSAPFDVAESAAPPDAGSTDAGVPDAEVPDAGAPDEDERSLRVGCGCGAGGGATGFAAVLLALALVRPRTRRVRPQPRSATKPCALRLSAVSSSVASNGRG